MTAVFKMDKMENATLDVLVQQLATGFDALQGEYQKLHGQHQALEKKLASARHQYNELARQYGSAQSTTPPLSLSSLSAVRIKPDTLTPENAADLLERSTDESSRNVAETLRIAATAAVSLRRGLNTRADATTHGVKIWSGASADAPDRASSMMPSISESPLEQDFTVEGRPSKLGCPFASMANKKLSSHAASVLSRYNSNGSATGPGSALSSTSRINGRESFSRRQGNRRESMVDPIQAEICAFSYQEGQDTKSEIAIEDSQDKQDSAEVPVCPIRFLNQHSPEEVATYFEKHKHELPRSHEVCVKRYQSNEAQIKQLDAKYGNLVSMIAGLGEKHKDMLPSEPEDMDDEAVADAESDEKVRKWASSVSAQAADQEDIDEEGQERLPHFERPLRDIRLGESPSRPWGIPVPTKYLEKAESHTSSKPAQVTSSPPNAAADNPTDDKQQQKRPPGKCPFGHGATIAPRPEEEITKAKAAAGGTSPLQAEPSRATAANATAPNVLEGKTEAHMVFTGPVFIGYNVEDAARLLRESAMGRSL